jgi:hypothetical protein
MPAWRPARSKAKDAARVHHRTLPG